MQNPENPTINPVIERLVVVDIPDAKSFPIDDGPWKDCFFKAEECTAKLLVGTAQDISQLPEAIQQEAAKTTNNRRARIYRGGEAYSHLLHLTAGMLDKRLGEKKTAEEISDAWKKFSQGRPDRIANFDKLMQYIFADSAAIRRHAFNDRASGNYLHPTSSEPAVIIKNMVDFKPNDTVLIMGEKPGITVGVIQALDHKHRNLIITNPDAEELDQLSGELATLKAGRIKATLNIVPYKKTLENFCDAQYVVNCHSMAASAHNTDLLLHWDDHAPAGAKLIHLRGDPTKRNATSEEWKETDVSNIVFPEEIQAQKKLDVEHNNKQFGLAQRAVKNCITSRLRGTQPVASRILDEPAEYSALVSKVPRRVFNGSQPFRDKISAGQNQGDEIGSQRRL